MRGSAKRLRLKRTRRMSTRRDCTRSAPLPPPLGPHPLGPPRSPSLLGALRRRETTPWCPRRWCDAGDRWEATLVGGAAGSIGIGSLIAGHGIWSGAVVASLQVSAPGIFGGGHGGRRRHHGHGPTATHVGSRRREPPHLERAVARERSQFRSRLQGMFTGAVPMSDQGLHWDSG